MNGDKWTGFIVLISTVVIIITMVVVGNSMKEEEKCFTKEDVTSAYQLGLKGRIE